MDPPGVPQALTARHRLSGEKAIVMVRRDRRGSSTCNVSARPEDRSQRWIRPVVSFRAATRLASGAKRISSKGPESALYRSSSRPVAASQRTTR